MKKLPTLFLFITNSLIYTAEPPLLPPPPPPSTFAKMMDSATAPGAGDPAGAAEKAPETTALHEAVLENNCAEVKKLLTQERDQFNVNVTNNQGETPLFYATTENMVKLLLNYNADPKWMSNGGKTPLELLRMTYDGERDAMIAAIEKYIARKHQGTPEVMRKEFRKKQKTENARSAAAAACAKEVCFVCQDVFTDENPFHCKQAHGSLHESCYKEYTQHGYDAAGTVSEETAKKDQIEADALLALKIALALEDEDPDGQIA